MKMYKFVLSSVSCFIMTQYSQSGPIGMNPLKPTNGKSIPNDYNGKYYFWAPEVKHSRDNFHLSYSFQDEASALLISSPDHSSIVISPHGEAYYIAYHTHCVLNGSILSDNRIVSMEKSISIKMEDSVYNYHRITNESITNCSLHFDEITAKIITNYRKQL